MPLLGQQPWCCMLSQQCRCDCMLGFSCMLFTPAIARMRACMHACWLPSTPLLYTVWSSDSYAEVSASWTAWRSCVWVCEFILLRGTFHCRLAEGCCTHVQQLLPLSCGTNACCLYACLAMRCGLCCNDNNAHTPRSRSRRAAGAVASVLQEVFGLLIHVLCV